MFVSDERLFDIYYFEDDETKCCTYPYARKVALDEGRVLIPYDDVVRVHDVTTGYVLSKSR